PVGVGLRRQAHRVDLDLAGRRAERMALGIADLAGEGYRVVRGRQARQPALAKRVEVVDDAGRQLAQPLFLGLVVVAGDPETPRQLGADVEVVAALAHRLDRLLHEDRVVARARPGGVDIVAPPGPR